MVNGTHQGGFLVPDGRQVDLAHPGGTQEQDRAPMGHRPQCFGDCSGSTDGFDDQRESTHEHDVGLPADDAGADDLPQLFEIPLSGVAADDMVSATRQRRLGLMIVTGDHGHGTAGIKAFDRRHGGQPDDAGTDHEDGIAIVSAGSQEAVTGDGEWFEQARTTVRHRRRGGGAPWWRGPIPVRPIRLRDPE